MNLLGIQALEKPTQLFRKKQTKTICKALKYNTAILVNKSSLKLLSYNLLKINCTSPTFRELFSLIC